MGRVYNFSAGPACLPEAVLKKASEQMLDYEGSGMSDRRSIRALSIKLRRICDLL